MTKEIELKPCPFCTSDKRVIQESAICTRPFSVVCFGCYCKTDSFYTKQEAIDKWNTRNAPPAKYTGKQLWLMAGPRTEGYERLANIPEWEHLAEVINADAENTSEIERLKKDKDRLDWIERNRVQLNCSMGAPGIYHYQVGSHPSQSSYREAIDARISMKLSIDK